MDNNDVERQSSSNLLLEENKLAMDYSKKKLTLNYENELVKNGISQINLGDQYFAEPVSSNRNFLLSEGQLFELFSYNEHETCAYDSNEQMNLNSVYITELESSNEKINVNEERKLENTTEDYQKKNDYHGNVLVKYAISNEVYSPTEKTRISMVSNSFHLEENPNYLEHISVDDIVAYDAEIEEFQYQQIILKSIPIRLSRKMESYVWSCLVKINHHENEVMLRVCFL